MLTDSPAFSGFSVNDLDAARRFYEETLGLRTSDVEHGRHDAAANSAAAGTCSCTPRPTTRRRRSRCSTSRCPTWRRPSTSSTARGVRFERYENPPTDEKGIMRAGGPLIAWFTDPAGNVFSVIEED